MDVLSPFICPLILIDSSTGSPVHVLMLYIQAGILSCTHHLLQSGNQGTKMYPPAPVAHSEQRVLSGYCCKVW